MHSSQFSISITPKSKTAVDGEVCDAAVKSKIDTPRTMSSKNTEEECVICCQKFTGIHGQHAPRRLPCRCRKSMCDTCVNTVLKSNDTCPFCRDVLLCRSSKELPICDNVPRQLRVPNSMYIDSPYSSATARLQFMQQQLRDVQRARGGNSAILQQAMRYTEQQLLFLQQAEQSAPNGLPQGEIPRNWAGQSRWLPGKVPSGRTNKREDSAVNSYVNSVVSSRLNSRNNSRLGSLAGSQPPSLAGSQPPSLAGSRAASVAGSRPGSVAGSRPASVSGSRPPSVCESRAEYMDDCQPDSSSIVRPASVNFAFSLSKSAARPSAPPTTGAMPRRPVRPNFRRLGSCRSSQYSSRWAWLDNPNGLVEPPLSLSTLYEGLSLKKPQRSNAMTLSNGLHLAKTWNENQSSPFIINQMSLTARSTTNLHN